MESLLTKIPSILMVIFFIGIIVSTWIALDPIRQKNRKSQYFLVTLICFIGFVLVAWWDMG
jgi:UDP-N-acetylmuramyl pentapeptide phosphotransferase/UDP-N-acetylglucosamine-1-phosphate transferase